MIYKLIKKLSLNDLSLIDHKEVDIVITGGGFIGFYLIGVAHVLRRLMKKNHITVRRFAGASVGALFSILMVLDTPLDDCIRLYDHLRDVTDGDIIGKLREEVRKLLPSDAYKRCDGRVYISITSFQNWLPSNMIVNTFRSNDELLDACMASCFVPFVLSPKMYYRFNNMRCIDGCFTNNVPVFTDGSARYQLIIRLYKIPYPIHYILRPYDDSIELLMVKGTIECAKFLSKNHNTSVFEWLDTSSTKKNTNVAYFFFMTGILSMAGFVLIKRFRTSR